MRRNSRTCSHTRGGVASLRGALTRLYHSAASSQQTPRSRPYYLWISRLVRKSAARYLLSIQFLHRLRLLTEELGLPNTIWTQYWQLIAGGNHVSQLFAMRSTSVKSAGEKLTPTVCFKLKCFSPELTYESYISQRRQIWRSDSRQNSLSWHKQTVIIKLQTEFRRLLVSNVSDENQCAAQSGRIFNTNCFYFVNICQVRSRNPQRHQWALLGTTFFLVLASY